MLTSRVLSGGCGRDSIHIKVKKKNKRLCPRTQSFLGFFSASFTVVATRVAGQLSFFFFSLLHCNIQFVNIS